MKKIILIVAVCMLGALALAACGNVPMTVTTSPMIRNLSASGQGKVYMVPDVAYINIGVRVDADEVSAALAKNNLQAAEVSKALQELGVDVRDIQTSNFNVYPMSDYGVDGQISRKYFIVENTVYVTVRALAKIGEILDAVVRSGANTINGISFDVVDKTEAQSKARDMAIEKARAEAEAIANTAGVKLGELQSVNVYMSSGPIPMYDAKGIGGMMEASSSVPVSAGQLLITVDANVVYEIK